MQLSGEGGETGMWEKKLLDAYYHELKTSFSREREVAVVGAGPVGLMISYWLLFEGRNVTLYESRSFSRGQILYMLEEFWEEVPEIVRTHLTQSGLCFYDDNPLLCSTKGKWISLHIAEFQTAMLTFLTQLNQRICRLEDAKHGICHVWGKFTFVSKNVNLSYLMSSKYDIVVVADGGGSTSLVRPLWKLTCNCDTDAFFHIPIANAAVITFQAWVDEKVATKKSVQRLFEKKNGKQRIFVTYRALPNYGYVGLQLSDQSMTELLKETDKAIQFQLFLTLPEGKLFQHLVKELGYKDMKNMQLNVFPILLKSAKEFYYQVGHQHFFVVGDAAFTTHFFTGTGMNRGLMTAKELLNVLDGIPLHYPSYNTRVIQLRNTLWKEVIPAVLFEVNQVLQQCRELSLSDDDMLSCFVSESRSHKYDNERVKQILLSRIQKDKV